MKYSNPFFAVTLAIASFGAALSVNADTVKARCDVFPKGEDRAKSSGLCTFSQRQGNVGIQLQNGNRYDLTSVGDESGNYQDQNGKAAYRQSGLGNRGQIYRLATESIFVYWDTAPYEKSTVNQTGDISASPIATRGISTLKSKDATSRINVRSQPTINSRSPHYGLSGDKVKVIECVEDGDNPSNDLNWCKVKFVNSSATGWIRSDFIIFADGGE